MIMITIKFAVGLDYIEGDYAVLYGNAGEGSINWETPLSNQIPLFPNRQGIYGYGHAPYGQHPYGRAYSTGPLGYGHLPYGRHPYGLASELIEADTEVSECGDYKFAFAAYDEAGNEDEGTPEQITVTVHIAPQSPPAGLKKNSYENDSYCNVAGDVSPDCTGKFVEYGTYNGYPYYRREDGQWFIWRRPGCYEHVLSTGLGIESGSYWQRLDPPVSGEYSNVLPATGTAYVMLFTANVLVLDVAA